VSQMRRDASVGKVGWVFSKIVPGERVRGSVRPIL
jgi:hypothetical protein